MLVGRPAHLHARQQSDGGLSEKQVEWALEKPERGGGRTEDGGDQAKVGRLGWEVGEYDGCGVFQIQTNFLDVIHLHR